MSQKSPIIEKHGDVTALILGKEFENLDEQNLDMIRKSLMDEAFAASPARVVIDLSNTKFFGSSFIEVLFRIWNRINAVEGGRFGIAGLSPYCREVLEVTHLDKLWSLYPDLKTAVKELSA